MNTTTVEFAGAKAIFEDTEDIQLAATYSHYNTYAFDSSLPHNTQVRWATLSPPPGIFAINGWLFNEDPVAPAYLFIDQRLRFLYPHSNHLINLILLHEMCHFRAPFHDSAFVKELLTTLERVSWEPLALTCVPLSLDSLFSK